MPVQKLYRHTAARHGRMILFANDTGAVATSLLRYGEWAEGEIAFMASLFGEGATVLDVGAYIGTHTLAFSRLVGVGGRVIAFEPQPPSFRVLERNIAFNRLANVELHNVAVGEAPGEAAFRPTDPAASSSFGSVSLDGRTDAAREPRIARVPVVAIDGLGLDRCDLIKIDVEGMERLVIEGARDTINRHRPWLYAECNSVEAGQETRCLLQALGYGVRLHLVEAFNPGNVRGEADNVFADAREAALVGVPPGRAATLEARPMRHGEMLLEIETTDDLVLGMLNKPQYVGEVLRVGVSAASGGDRWIRDSTQALAVERAAEIERLSAQLGRTQEALDSTQALAVGRAAEIERLSAQLGRTQEALDSTQALAVGRTAEVERLSAQLGRTQEALDSAQALAVERFREIGALEAKVEATLRQADIARSLYRRETGALEAARSEALETASSEAARFASALADAHAEHDRQREQVAALLGSTSWRLTRPVRAVGRALRRR